MATSKQVRKLESTTQGEVLEVEMAVRDEDGKRIKSNYATKSELTAAQTALGNANDANTAAIAGLTTRVGTAETNITSNATAISNEATARATAVSNEATARANADTALGGRIDGLEDDVEELESDMQENFQRVEEVAQGASRTFVLQAADGDGGSFVNQFFNSENDVVEMPYGSTQSGYAVFYQMECPRGSLPDAYVSQYGLTANVLLIPETLSAADKAAISAIPNKFSNMNVQVVEIKVGDNILIKEVGKPDRWLGAVDLQNQTFVFYRMEMSKVNIESLNTAISGKMDNKTIDSAPTEGNTTHLVSSAGVATALAGKQDTLTFDSTPTDNSSNPVTSGGVKAAIDALQSNLGLTSSSAGTVTISD